MDNFAHLDLLKTREAVSAILSQHGLESEAASIDLCKLMDWRFDLAGNGWWDNDPVMMKELDLDGEEEEE